MRYNDRAKLNKKSATRIALEQVPGHAIKDKMKFKNGRYLYEIEIENESGEYEIHVDATTGEILKVKKEIK